MPRGPSRPNGEKRPADVSGKAVHVMRIATGQIGRRPQDHFSEADFGASNSV
jgi:hypothetical protein